MEELRPEGEHKRRVRYSGTHPQRFNEKYKELDPERYVEDIEKVKQRGQTPAGMHRSICMDEVLQFLQPTAGETGLDATLGYGGHSAELLARVQPGGRLFATDVDPIELPRTEARLRALGYPPASLIIKQQNFAGIQKLLPLTDGGFDFVLADLGVSSMQIDNPQRGFTFKVAGPLDLRLNPQRGQSAAALLEGISEVNLEKMLHDNADEPFAKLLAPAICARRGTVKTTTDLATIIRQVLDELVLEDREKLIVKTLQRCFQALRIAVNDEFSALDTLLRSLPWCLRPGARVAILTFHSGEDKRVMQAFEAGLAAGSYREISTEPIRASAQERFDNPRSKSARLRLARAI